MTAPSFIFREALNALDELGQEVDDGFSASTTDANELSAPDLTSSTTQSEVTRSERSHGVLSGMSGEFCGTSWI